MTHGSGGYLGTPLTHHWTKISDGKLSDWLIPYALFSCQFILKRDPKTLQTAFDLWCFWILAIQKYSDYTWAQTHRSSARHAWSMNDSRSSCEPLACGPGAYRHKEPSCLKKSREKLRGNVNLEMAFAKDLLHNLNRTPINFLSK